MKIFYDTETTGIREDAGARLVQLAYKILSDNGPVVFDELFNPGVEISTDAMAVNHITNEMVADKPVFTDSNMAKHFQSLIDEGGIFIAHNAAFDVEFLRRGGVEIPKEQSICTLKVAHHHDKKAQLKKYNLQYLRYHYALQFDEEINPHDALSDVIVLEKLFEQYEQHYSIEEMLKISQEPILYKKMPFGKHVGQWFKDVARSDLDYLVWARKTWDLDENMKHTLEYYINNR